VACHRCCCCCCCCCCRRRCRILSCAPTMRERPQAACPPSPPAAWNRVGALHPAAGAAAYPALCLRQLQAAGGLPLARQHSARWSCFLQSLWYRSVPRHAVCRLWAQVSRGNRPDGGRPTLPGKSSSCRRACHRLAVDWQWTGSGAAGGRLHSPPLARCCHLLAGAHGPGACNSGLTCHPCPSHPFF
jgi:hypothetical protein